MIRPIIIAVFFALPASAHDFPAQIDRLVDADTLDMTARVDFPARVQVSFRVRLYCINAAESDTEEGQELTRQIEAMSLTHGRVDPIKKDAFGRWLAFFRPAGWDISLNEWLYRQGAPLYHRLTRAERALCEQRLGIAP